MSTADSETDKVSHDAAGNILLSATLFKFAFICPVNELPDNVYIIACADNTCIWVYVGTCSQMLANLQPAVVFAAKYLRHRGVHLPTGNMQHLLSCEIKLATTQ